MIPLKIFAEGKGDVKFLKDYISHTFNVDLADNDFDPIGGWSKYKSGGKLIQSIQQARFDQKEIVLILDADTDFDQRQREVRRDFETFNVSVKLFLFPKNYESGNLETLLAEVAEKRTLMDCFLEYERCVAEYPKPLNDARIYSYLDMLLHANPFDEQRQDMRKEEFRNYRNPAHWDLHHAALEPLKSFLTPFFE